MGLGVEAERERNRLTGARPGLARRQGRFRVSSPEDKFIHSSAPEIQKVKLKKQTSFQKNKRRKLRTLGGAQGREVGGSGEGLRRFRGGGNF